MALPKILLLTEAVLSEESVGASRTLLNLLKEYPAENILLYSPTDSFKTHRYLPPFNQRNAFFNFYFLRPVRNRLGWMLNPMIKLLNFLWMEGQPIRLNKEIKKFEPDILLSVPLFPETMIITRRVIHKYRLPAYLYLMDDWITENNDNWIFNSLKKTSKEVLRGTDWLMISPSLRDRFIDYFSIPSPRCMIVHNPVEVKEFAPPVQKTSYTLAYAGSIWAMHKDALQSVSRAVKELTKRGMDVSLKLYCTENFYLEERNFWEENATIWGGLVPYTQLNEVLQEADLLVVTTAFDLSVAHLVRTSVLTKTTDYMNTGRAMLSVGPSYSATNRFVREYGVGYVLDSNELNKMTEKIGAILLDEKGRQEQAYHAWKVLKEQFSANVITQQLAAFLSHA